jgi:hypothetical protein
VRTTNGAIVSTPHNPRRQTTVHTRSKSSHHFVVSAAEAAEMRRAAALGDDICKRLAEKHRNQRRYEQTARDPIANAVASVNKLSALLKASAPVSHARGDDDDRRTIIADLISDDRSPFTPEDEEALRYMSHGVLREMKRQYLKANSSVANTQLANRDFSFGSGIAGADFARRQAQLRANSDAYIRRNPITRGEPRVTTNSNDPAVQAMSAGGLVAHFAKGA